MRGADSRRRPCNATRRTVAARWSRFAGSESAPHVPPARHRARRDDLAPGQGLARAPGQGAQPGYKPRQADGSKSTVAVSLFQIGRRAPGGGPAASESMPNTGHSCTLNSLRATDRARKRRVGWRGGGGKFRLPIPAAEARSARHYWVSPAVWRAATAPDRRARRAAASPRRGRVSRPERPGWIVPRPLTSADRLAGRTLAWRASA